MLHFVRASKKFGKEPSQVSTGNYKLLRSWPGKLFSAGSCMVLASAYVTSVFKYHVAMNDTRRCQLNLGPSKHFRILSCNCEGGLCDIIVALDRAKVPPTINRQLMEGPCAPLVTRNSSIVEECSGNEVLGL